MHVYKAKGYGFADLVGTADPRINTESYLIRPSDYDFAGFCDFMKDSKDFDDICSLKITLNDCVHFGEVGGRFAICLVPPCKTDKWVRVDNSIDMVESESGTSRILCLSQGLPGYRSWVDSRNGKWVCSSTYYIFQKVYQHYQSPAFCEAEKYTDECTLADLASDLGFRTMTDVLSYVVPSVPTIIDRLCAYLNLFVDSSICAKLRPMVYTYWK